MSSIKVLFCTDGIFPHSVGGIQRHSKLLISALADRGEVELTVIHPHAGERIFADYPQIKEIVVQPLSTTRNYLLALYSYSKQVAAIAKQHPEHLIYAQGLTVWHEIKALGKRVIFNPHGLEPFQPLSLRDRGLGLPYQLIYRRIFKYAAKTVALGGRLTSILHQHVPQAEQKVVILPNATLLPPERRVPPRFQEKAATLRCLFLGRFASNKGITHLIEAARQLHESGQSEAYHFTLAGKGPLYESLRVHEDLLPNVDMPGFVDDDQLVGLFQDHDLFILPTLSEGMPTVVLEAMGYGMPIIVTDVGATKELVDASNGYIIDKQSPEAILEALDSFSHLSLQAKQAMAASSRARVAQHFIWDKVAEMHEHVFQEMATRNTINTSLAIK